MSISPGFQTAQKSHFNSKIICNNLKSICIGHCSLSEARWKLVLVSIYRYKGGIFEIKCFISKQVCNLKNIFNFSFQKLGSQADLYWTCFLTGVLWATEPENKNGSPTYKKPCAQKRGVNSSLF